VSSRWPATVTSVDRDRREVRVDIPGITDGADEMPIADIEYPIGDRSAQTEIRILPGDDVWVAFHGGDPRYPIITGFRVKQTGNEVGTRRWVHDNFELTADEEYKLTAGTKVTIIVGSTTFVLEGSKATLTSPNMEFHGASKFFGNVECTQTITATVDVIGGNVSLKTHLTTGVDPGSGLSGLPQPS
jgi:hypothetical protein